MTPRAGYGDGMTKVFVHGNPETPAIWSGLVAELNRRGVDDIVTLAPPGFGAPSPQGWGATQSEYLGWLARELAAFDEIDLVGHDWGAGHVYGIIAGGSVRVRTWAADCAGLLHPDYVWHDAAQGWQTPGLGEQMVAGMAAMDIDTMITAFGSMGITETIVREMKPWVNDEMARCVLALYRSAAQPAMRELGERFVATAPPDGLVIIAENDHYAGPHTMHEEMASAVGAEVAHLHGVGHWWMIEDPVAGADMLTAHWAG